ncbi:hypothetical protein AYI68_g1514 [Smittium mucronatum]|uniref:Uncharacterized protein n=1 Tax=Smittium mucronatum TaxID=133383 RepID=A0A1R0H570_9FUNG|nr:hypothetical protein AYI68_g1514 [Smittium mucronatum]
MPIDYQPPPLNEAAPTTAKKMVSTLVGYQILLAQITRPLDQKPVARRKGTFKMPFRQRQQQAFSKASATATNQQATSNYTGNTKNANHFQRKESQKIHQRSKNQSSM